MNEQEIKKIVEDMVRQMSGHQAKGNVAHTQSGTVSGGCLDDITAVDLRQQYLIEHPKNAAAFQALKVKTPARVGLSRAGARYKTETMLRVRADHAAAQDSVFSMVPKDWAQQKGYLPVTTLCTSKDEYLTRPDKGRRFDEENQAIIKKTLGQNPKVILVVGDGLSSTAIEANAADCAAAIQGGLKNYSLTTSPILFIEYCRVGASDHIGELTGGELVCMLVGERPGLVTAESMSAYLTYMPRLGIPESKRTVVSNIHKGGTTAVEAGAHIAQLIHTILQQKASGVDLNKGAMA